MTNTHQKKLHSDVTTLMRESGKAHHKAYLITDGEDDEWPIWYADYLQQPLGRLFSMTFTRSQIVYCLMSVEFERQAVDPNLDWPGYYADHFIAHFATEESPITDKLALYYAPWCPFCQLVLRSIEHLNIDVELRNTSAEQHHHNDLVAARNRATIPVLRITPEQGEDRWMSESQDIINYLEKTYGQMT